MLSRTYIIRTEGDVNTLDSFLFRALVSLNQRSEPIKLDISGKKNSVFGHRKFIVEERGVGELSKEHLVLGGSVTGKKFIVTIKYRYPRGWGWSDIFELFFQKIDKEIKITINRINGMGRTTPGYIIEILKTIVIEENYESILEVFTYE